MRITLVRTAALLAILLVAPAVPTPARAAAAKSASPAAAGHVLPWIADDLARATAEAKARKLPLFVESWAPW